LTETFELSGVDPQGPDAYVQIILQGLLNVEHQVHVVINGVDAGILTGSGKTRFGATIVVPQNLLLEGTNSVTLNTVMSNDANYFDSIKVNFSRRLRLIRTRYSFIIKAIEKLMLRDLLRLTSGFSTQLLTATPS
jgi:hypothetical protein